MTPPDTRAVLEPFAKLAEDCESCGDDVVLSSWLPLTVGHVRAAKALYDTLSSRPVTDGGWRSMESAPKDKNILIAYSVRGAGDLPDFAEVTIADWREFTPYPGQPKVGTWVGEDGTGYPSAFAWRPLPDPPVEPAPLAEIRCFMCEDEDAQCEECRRAGNGVEQDVRLPSEAVVVSPMTEELWMALEASFGPLLLQAAPDLNSGTRMGIAKALADEVRKRAHWFTPQPDNSERMREALAVARNRLQAAAINSAAAGDAHHYEYAEWADEANETLAALAAEQSS